MEFYPNTFPPSLSKGAYVGPPTKDFSQISSKQANENHRQISKETTHSSIFLLRQHKSLSRLQTSNVDCLFIVSSLQIYNDFLLFRMKNEMLVGFGIPASLHELVHISIYAFLILLQPFLSSKLFHFSKEQGREIQPSYLIVVQNSNQKLQFVKEANHLLAYSMALEM